LTEVALGMLMPPFSVVVDERPLGFAVEREDEAGLFQVSFARGFVADRGVEKGCILNSVQGKEVAGLSKAEVQQLLKEAPMPVSLQFRPVKSSLSSTDEVGAVSSSGEEDDEAPVSSTSAAPTAAVAAEVPAADTATSLYDALPPAVPTSSSSSSPAPGPAPASAVQAARATRSGYEALEGGLSFFQVDLSKPLGIFFDKECRAERIGEKTQAADLKVLPGTHIRLVGGRRVTKTAQLVKRVGQAKKKGLPRVMLGVHLPTLEVTVPQRPLPFAWRLDAARGLVLVTEAPEAGRALGLEPDLALARIGAEAVAERTEEELTQLLATAPLPLHLTFRRQRTGGAQGDPELSGSDNEAGAGAG